MPAILNRINARVIWQDPAREALILRHPGSIFVEPEHKNVALVETGIDARNLDKTAQKQPGARQHNHRQRDNSKKNRAVSPRASSGARSRAAMASSTADGKHE